jgi:hypothetical protein
MLLQGRMHKVHKSLLFVHGYRRNRARYLASHKRGSSSWTFVVEKDAVASKDIVCLQNENG